MQLWDKLAAKAAATNWCASASARAPLPQRTSPKLR
jgi:hypothetical protein